MDTFRDKVPPGGLIAMVGSRATCSPPPTDTDEDYLVLVRNKYEATESLIELGFEQESDPERMKEYEAMSEETIGGFVSLRMGHVNYIVTDDVFFFERFLTGAYVAKALNLMDKKDRVLVHSAIRGSSYASRYFPGFQPDPELFRTAVRKFDDGTEAVALTNGEIDKRMSEAVTSSIVREQHPDIDWSVPPWEDGRDVPF